MKFDRYTVYFPIKPYIIHFTSHHTQNPFCRFF